MPNLFEDPTLYYVCGGLVEVVLLVVLWRTGRGVVLWYMAGVLAVGRGGVLLERLVVTDREQIQAAVEGARQAVAANDLPEVLSYMAPTATEIRQAAEEALRVVRFEEATVHDLQITGDRQARPPRAEARLTGVATLDARHGQDALGKYMATLKVQYELLEGRWLVTKVTEIRRFGL